MIDKLCACWLRHVLALFVSLASGAAQAQVACDEGVVFGFFNGVQTTLKQAQSARDHLVAQYGSSTPAGHPITYDLFYNDTEGLADFAETFDQRLREHDAVLTDRFELFFAVVKGDRDGWWGALIQAVPAAGALFSDLLETVMAKALQQLTRSLGDPSLAAVSQRHREQIDRWAAQDRKLLLFAHSQGNLFVNAAYAHALSKTDAASVRVVHVAPASPTISGRHTLADKDFVINGLRATGLVAPNTDIIVGYATRSAGVNGRRDPLGHGLLEIYLNAKLSTSIRLAADVNDALAELDSAPRKFAKPVLLEEASHSLDRIVRTTSEPMRFVKQADGTWHIELFPIAPNGTMSERYEGKGVDGSRECEWHQEDETQGWEYAWILWPCRAERLPDRFHSVPWGWFNGRAEAPDELRPHQDAAQGTVVALSTMTYSDVQLQPEWRWMEDAWRVYFESWLSDNGENVGNRETWFEVYTPERWSTPMCGR